MTEDKVFFFKVSGKLEAQDEAESNDLKKKNGNKQ